MIERQGDLWAEDVEGWTPGDPAPWIVIPTNGEWKSNGDAVMGAGVAKDAARRFSTLPARLGERLKSEGNHVFYFGLETIGDRHVGVVTMPTKHQWRRTSSLELIERSAIELRVLVERHRPSIVILPRVGTGCGGLGWVAVRPVLERHLIGDVYVVVTHAA